MRHLSILASLVLLAPLACSKDDDDGSASASASASAGTSASASASAGTAGTDGSGAEAGDENGGDGDGDDDGGTEGGNDSGDSAGDSDTDGFVPASDIPAANTCDPWAQDCPEGEKCAAYQSVGDTWDATKCVPITGDGVDGDACVYDGAIAGTDDCGAGLMCYNGVCTELCTGSETNQMCSEGKNCSVSNSGSLLLCLSDCNPLLQDCQAEGTACYWDFAGNFNCDPTTSDWPEGEPCNYINDCAAGGICIDATSLPSCNGAACCAAYCDLEDPNTICAIDGTECSAFWAEGEEVPGLENLGICLAPGG